MRNVKFLRSSTVFVEKTLFVTCMRSDVTSRAVRHETSTKNVTLESVRFMFFMQNIYTSFQFAFLR